MSVTKPMQFVGQASCPTTRGSSANTCSTSGIRCVHEANNLVVGFLYMGPRFMRGVRGQRRAYYPTKLVDPMLWTASFHVPLSSGHGPGSLDGATGVRYEARR